MPRHVEENEEPIADDDLLPAEGVEGHVSDLGEALSQETLAGIRNKPTLDALEDLDLLEKKIEALIGYCEKLTLVNANLAKQLAKERESNARIQEVNSNARQRVDQLIQRLGDLEEAEK